MVKESSVIEDLDIADEDIIIPPFCPYSVNDTTLRIITIQEMPFIYIFVIVILCICFLLLGTLLGNIDPFVKVLFFVGAVSCLVLLNTLIYRKKKILLLLFNREKQEIVLPQVNKKKKITEYKSFPWMHADLSIKRDWTGLFQLSIILDGDKNHLWNASYASSWIEYYQAETTLKYIEAFMSYDIFAQNEEEEQEIFAVAMKKIFLPPHDIEQWALSDISEFDTQE